MRICVLLSCSLLPLVACSDYGMNDIEEGDVVGGERQLLVEPEVIDFGLRTVGDTITDTFTITSVGATTVELEPLHISGSGTFTLLGDSVEGPLAPGEFVEVEVAYTPATPEDEADAVVESNAEASQIYVELLGEGEMPDLVYDPQQVVLQSWDGNPVYGSFLVRNEGLVDLVVESWVLQGENFTAETDLPGTLGPGEETEVDVSWTPVSEGEELGYFWASSNDPDGSEVATLQGIFEPPCLGLHEAHTRGLVDMYGNVSGIYVEHLGEDQDVCIDRWYVYISEDTQDAGAGDPAFLESDVYGEEGSIELSDGSSVFFEPASATQPAWWCVEETQTTDTAHSFDFTGAQVPPMLLDRMLDDRNQDLVWSDISDNPVMIVGRTRGWASMVAGGSTAMEVEVINIGRIAGVAHVSETVPAGMEAYNFGVEPHDEAVGEDGSITYSWEISLEAAQDTGITSQTVYDSQILGYTLEVGDEACTARARTPEPVVSWIDASDNAQSAAGSPFIIECW